MMIESYHSYLHDIQRLSTELLAFFVGWALVAQYEKSVIEEKVKPPIRVALVEAPGRREQSAGIETIFDTSDIVSSSEFKISCETHKFHSSQEKTKGGFMTNPKYLGNLDFSAFPELPSKQVWIDYKKHRQAKRAPITQTVVNRLGKQLQLAHEAGYSVDDCLGEAMEAGWQGFKFTWMVNRCPPTRKKKSYGDF